MAVDLTKRQRDAFQQQLHRLQFDPEVGLVKVGRPHETAIAHLTESHASRETAEYVLLQGLLSDGCWNSTPALTALLNMFDKDPHSATYGCPKWYWQSERVVDTNAAFFVGLPLACHYMLWADRLRETERDLLTLIFRYLLKWFEKQARNPNLVYPNKVLSDAALLYTLGRFLNDPSQTAQGIEFCRRWFEYWKRRGCGWGEDHSIQYTKVLVEAAQLILTNCAPDDLRDVCIEFLDGLAHFVAFHEGREPTPGIRTYNFDGNVMAVDASYFDPEPTSAIIAVTRARSGYRPPAFSFSAPRQLRRRTFDNHYSVSWVDRHARLGTLSRWPLFPNMYHHDTWGLGWQSMPAAFIADDEDLGYLQWVSIDEYGVRRTHPARDFLDFASRPLFRRLSFLPEVVQIAHQEKGAAIILREIRKLHAPIRLLVDRWRIPKGKGKVLLGGSIQSEDASEACFKGWCVLQYPNCAIAIWPLHVRAVGNSAPRRLPLRVRQDAEEGLLIELELYSGEARVLTEPLLYTGWCIVLLNRPEEVEGWTVEETFELPAEIPRTYHESIRTVTLTGPGIRISLRHDPLEDQQARTVQEL